MPALSRVRSELESKCREIENYKKSLQASGLEQDSNIDSIFDSYEEILVDRIRGYLANVREGFKAKVQLSIQEYEVPLTETLDVLQLLLIENKEASNDIAAFVSKRNSFPLSVEDLDSILSLEEKIEVNKGFTRHPVIARYESVYRDLYGDDDTRAKYLTEFRSQYGEALSPVFEKIAYDSITRLDRVFGDLERNSWNWSDYVIDPKLTDAKRKRLPSVSVDGLAECYATVKLLMGKFLKIERGNFSFPDALATNPSGIKYLQAMLKSLPLTVKIEELYWGLSSNAIDESRFMDVCRNQ